MDIVLAVAVAVAVVALLRADVVHLVDGAALGAALDGAVARAGQPDDDVGVGRVAGAAKVLLVAEGLDGDGVVDGALPAGIERAHVEDVHALHLSEDFETLETGGLLEIGGHGTGLGALGEEVVLGGDLW